MGDEKSEKLPSHQEVAAAINADLDGTGVRVHDLGTGLRIVVDTVFPDEARDVVDSILARQAGRLARVKKEWDEFARMFPEEAKFIRSWADHMKERVDTVHARVGHQAPGDVTMTLSLRIGRWFDSRSYGVHAMKTLRDPIGAIEHDLTSMLRHAERMIEADRPR